MESEILNLIQTDQKTREAVEEAHRMKFELKRKIADTEQELKRLQAHYLEKKEEWRKELVRRCLEI